MITIEAKGSYPFCLLADPSLDLWPGIGKHIWPGNQGYNAISGKGHISSAPKEISMKSTLNLLGVKEKGQMSSSLPFPPLFLQVTYTNNYK
jgi:hypothetical protein